MRYAMSRNPTLLKEMREAIRQAERDLDSVKLKTAEETPGVDRLRGELHASVLKDRTRFAKDARCLSARAKKLSAQHTRESAQMKKRSKDAADLLTAERKRYPHKG